MSITQPESIVKANSVIGVKVKNKNDENLGKIEEIMLDKLSGEVHYVVLSFGGVMGLGEKLFALPWNAISYVPAENSFILNIDKDILKNAPGFDKNNWPDMADPIWVQKIKSFYGDFDSIKHGAENFKEKAKEKFESLSCKSQDALKKGAEEAKKSGEDWLNYLQEHPLQSLAFGMVAYFAVKGMVKE